MQGTVNPETVSCGWAGTVNWPQSSVPPTSWWANDPLEMMILPERFASPFPATPSWNNQEKLRITLALETIFHPCIFLQTRF